jgi:hypothetical protein
VQVQLALAGSDLKSRRFEIVRSRCELTRFRTTGATAAASATRDWWGRADLTGSQIVLGRPVTSAGPFHAELRDTAPLVALYANRRDLPGWAYGCCPRRVRADATYTWQPATSNPRPRGAGGEPSCAPASAQQAKERHGRMLLTWRRGARHPARGWRAPGWPARGSGTKRGAGRGGEVTSAAVRS